MVNVFVISKLLLRKCRIILKFCLCIELDTVSDNDVMRCIQPLNSGYIVFVMP